MDELCDPIGADHKETDGSSTASTVEDLDEKKQEYEKVAAKWGRDLQLNPFDSNPRSVRVAASFFLLSLFLNIFAPSCIHSSVRKRRPTAAGCYLTSLLFRTLRFTI